MEPKKKEPKQSTKARVTQRKPRRPATGWSNWALPLNHPISGNIRANQVSV
jgi:hypothetical protein